MAQELVCALPKQAATGDLTIDVITDPRELACCREQWDRLAAESGVSHPFASHAWLSTWWECFGQGRQLRIFVVKSSSDWIAVAPMMIHTARMFGVAVRRLDSIYNSHVPRFEFLIKERHADVYCRLWQAMSDEAAPWDAIVLQQFVADSPTLAAVERLAISSRWRTGRWSPPPSPFIPLGCSYETLLNRLGPSTRSNLRKRQSKLSELGPLDIEVINSPLDVATAMKEGMRIEAAAWKGRAGTAMISDPTVAEFYQRVAARTAEKGWLKLIFLRVGGKRIAFNYILDFAGVLYCLKIGYDPEYQAYSPGNMLRDLLLKEACTQGYRECDLLGVVDHWKLLWTREARPHCWLFMFRNRLPLRLLHHAKFVLLPAVRRRERLMRLASAVCGLANIYRAEG